MASADELRKAIQTQREALKATIAAAAGKWNEAGNGEEWPPARVAQHVIGGEVNYANHVSNAMLGKPTAWESTELATAEAALARLAEAEAVADKAYRYVEDRDLTKKADTSAGTPRDVETTMRMAAEHLAEHVDHMKKTAGL
ncbi:MAG: DinB family protein [Chloroflexi bacterium]|nr:DinB family protein [Chloroflexota bacterium]MDA1241125.1 DinB family protein [Chloroflexota bacterium]